MKNKMKMNKMIASVAILGLISGPVMADTSGSILLQGSIAQILSVEVTETDGHDSLNLTENAVDVEVASVLEKSNVQKGYKIFVDSQNDGLLKNGEVGSITYDLKYDGKTVNMADPSIPAKEVPVFTAFEDTSLVSISYVAPAVGSLPAGSYSDTVTVSIVAN